MPTFFQRPENALKRANEFIDVGKKQRALDALYDVIKSKKHRTWQKIHEPIMGKYLELCVDLKKSHVAKEGLYQYKNICQQVNIKSLEDVVRAYLALAEEKTESARQESHQAVVDVDDLDVIQTPENLLLSAVSGEDTQDRTDRAILTPWVKFLWESYRQCLDLLRNNSSVEKLYQDVAQQAFKFCLKYERKTEFRKLCDNLRTHLGHIHKHQHQQRAINLNNVESQAMHLETRLVQLDSAIQMELWQEAFKAVEDIHGLIALSKKSPKPSLMAMYYQKLGLVFWKSGNHMFHACAWHRMFHLSREQKKNLSQDELQKLSSRVVCATLAIPIPPARNQIDTLLEMDDNTMEKQRRLATLLGLQNPPNRDALIKDLVKLNMVQHVLPEIQNLYRWLEVEFHPLKLSSRVSALLEFIGTKDDLSQYVSALQDITITRLVKQVSQVYQTIEFARLAKLVPFATPFRLERVIVDASRSLELQVRIDHCTKSLTFGTDLGVSQKEDVPEGPYLQSMPSEQIRNQLTHMASSLESIINTVNPAELSQKRTEIRAHIVQTYKQTAKKEHQRILQRRQIIEERKEEIENLNNQREQEEMMRIDEEKRVQYEAEMARLEREAEERDRQRRLTEHREIQKKVARERLEQLKSTSVGAKAFADLKEEEVAEMDVDDILAKQVEQLEKEKRELQEKLKSQEKKVDYFERAKRLEEIPLLKKQYEEESIHNREFWEQQQKEKIELLKEERQIALKTRDRLSLITEDKDEFLDKLMDSRMEMYKKKLVDFEKRLLEERKKRLEEHKVHRKEERRNKWVREREEDAQRKRDEELKRQREEEERVQREKREKEDEEYAERLRKLEEIEERKRQREREIEEKLRRDQTRVVDRPAESFRDRRPAEEERPWRRDGPPDRDRDQDRDRNRDHEEGGVDRAWRPKAKEGGWRERVKTKDDSWSRPSESDDVDEGKPRDDGSSPPREDRGRDERAEPPPRDRFAARDDRDRPPAHDDRERGYDDRDRGALEDTWRSRGPAKDPPAGRLADREPLRRALPDDERGGGGGRGEESSSWRKPAARDERAPPPRDDADRGGGSSWRSAPREDRDGDIRSRDDRRDLKPLVRESGGGGWRDRERERDVDRVPSRDDRGDDGGSWRSGGGGARVIEKAEPRVERDAWRGRDDPPREDAWRKGVSPPKPLGRMPARDVRLDEPEERMPARDVRFASRDERLPARDERPPAREERLPVKEERLPVREERLPVREERLPVREERLPVREERLPVREERLPVREERLPVREERLPVREERLPVREERLPVREERLPVRGEGPPARDEGRAPDRAPPRKLEEVEDDGWTTVTVKR